MGRSTTAISSSTSCCFQQTFTTSSRTSMLNSKSGEDVSSSSSSSPHPPSSRCIEVEEKFSIANYHDDYNLNNKNGSIVNKNNIEEKLIELGFEKQSSSSASKHNIEFMDWYFDLPDPDWVLSTSDNWLRFRELIEEPSLDDDHKIEGKQQEEVVQQRKGVWQLKSGKLISNSKECSQSSSSSADTSATTVYEEFENNEAIDRTISLLQEKYSNNRLSSDDTTSNNIAPISMEGYEIPILPPRKDAIYNTLIPFARIKTTRSSWKYKNDDDSNFNHSFRDLCVDIDCTDFGYMVGEVEQVVTNEEEVDRAKERIGRLIEQIIGNNKSDDDDDDDSSSNMHMQPTLGKLELYMLRNRKKHFDACVNSGSMKSK